MMSAALLVAAALAGATHLTASRGGQVPFQASFDTVFQSVFVPGNPPFLHITVQGEGQAEHMGRTETFTQNQIANLGNGHVTATYTLVAANGDTVVIEDETDGPPPDANGHVTFAGTYSVVSGTGRFAGAAGHGILRGAAQFTSQVGGVGEFTLDGTISSPGSLE
jgi:hypothetical protein